VEIGSTCDGTFDLIESDIIINNIRMEGDFKVDIFIGCNVTLFRMDGEELFTKGSIPTEMSSNVSKVSQL
jgi:hypothetical protein